MVDFFFKCNGFCRAWHVSVLFIYLFLLLIFNFFGTVSLHVGVINFQTSHNLGYYWNLDKVDVTLRSFYFSKKWWKFSIMLCNLSLNYNYSPSLNGISFSSKLIFIFYYEKNISDSVGWWKNWRNLKLFYNK